ncbi:MFS transporter [Micromonospora sp. NPDC002575]|uniref:MFS transporter n=1 Tax=Micromonospora sp. NPDC002575 TaxID=3364222 RepID=UPI0036AAD863
MSFTPGRSRWPDVWLATAARGISSCGDFLAASTLTLALQSAGAGGPAVAGLLVAASLPLVALAPLTGRLADRVDSRTLLVAAGVVQAAICLALAYAGHPALVIGLVALLAAGLAVTQPVLAALVPAMVTPADLPRASALNQTAGTLGALAGPALAGLLVGQFGSRVPLLLDAASYLALVAAGLLIRTRRGGARAVADPRPTPEGMRPTPGGPAGDGRPTLGGPARGWRLRQDRLLFAMVASLAGVVGAVGAINVIEVFFIRETLGSSTTVYGLVTGAWPLGIVAGAWALTPLARRLTDDGRLLGVGLLLLGGCCLAVLGSAAVPSAWLLVPIWLLGGLLNGGDNVVCTVLLARRVPEAARGRAYAIFGAAVQGAGMVGLAAGGLLLDLADPRPLVAACGTVGVLAVAAFAVPVVRAARAERRAERAVAPGSAATVDGAGQRGETARAVGSTP